MSPSDRDPRVHNLLDVEIQMTRELQLPGEDLLVDPEGVVVEERRVPAERSGHVVRSTFRGGGGYENFLLWTEQALFTAILCV